MSKQCAQKIATPTGERYRKLPAQQDSMYYHQHAVPTIDTLSPRFKHLHDTDEMAYTLPLSATVSYYAGKVRSYAARVLHTRGGKTASVISVRAASRCSPYALG
ncbi:MAG: hypothetical protein KTU85_10465 [Acidimicrobiia bacterium]|nr:hypothetical protein [Acidimicrobiia bacterium]